MWWWGRGSQPPKEPHKEREAPRQPPPTMYRVMYPWDLAALKALHSKLFEFDYDIGSFITALQSERFISLAAYPQPSPEALLGCIITTSGPTGAFLAMSRDTTPGSAPATAPAQPDPKVDSLGAEPPISCLSPTGQVASHTVSRQDQPHDTQAARERVDSGPIPTQGAAQPPAVSIGGAQSTSALEEQSSQLTVPDSADTPPSQPTCYGTLGSVNGSNSTSNAESSSSQNASSRQREGADPLSDDVEDSTSRLRMHPAVLQRLAQQPEEPCMYICWLGVSPAAQGGGVGSALLHHAFTCAEAAGAVHVLLHVQANNPGAQRFYHRQGFLALCTVPGFYELSDANHSLVDAVLMHHKLVDNGDWGLASNDMEEEVQRAGVQVPVLDASFNKDEVQDVTFVEDRVQDTAVIKDQVQCTTFIKNQVHAVGVSGGLLAAAASQAQHQQQHEEHHSGKLHIMHTAKAVSEKVMSCQQQQQQEHHISKRHNVHIAKAMREVMSCHQQQQQQHAGVHAANAVWDSELRWSALPQMRGGGSFYASSVACHAAPCGSLVQVGPVHRGLCLPSNALRFKCKRAVHGTMNRTVRRPVSQAVSPAACGMVHQLLGRTFTPVCNSRYGFARRLPSSPGINGLLDYKPYRMLNSSGLNSQLSGSSGITRKPPWFPCL